MPNEEIAEQGEIHHIPHTSMVNHLQKAFAAVRELVPPHTKVIAKLTTLEDETHIVTPEDIDVIVYDHHKKHFRVFLKGHKKALICSAGALALAAASIRLLTHKDAPSNRS